MDIDKMTIHKIDFIQFTTVAGIKATASLNASMVVELKNNK